MLRQTDRRTNRDRDRNNFEGVQRDNERAYHKSKHRPQQSAFPQCRNVDHRHPASATTGKQGHQHHTTRSNTRHAWKGERKEGADTRLSQSANNHCDYVDKK
ncbi:hypothetical protein ElyMa_000181500 [Elysia marginata]|uniref:Uncharacterized protein n=1 Tax=Elysia marginata TaxID=1093978 RepID=A0AAV4EVL8_9GAST|nr:hypothetical protein ElyMa_000181500 [Elysia marginata]